MQTVQQTRSTEGEHELHTVHRKCTTLANTKREPFNGDTPKQHNVQTVVQNTRRQYRPSSGNIFNESSPAQSTKLHAFIGNARKVQAVDQKIMMAICLCEAFIRNSKPGSSHCAYRNRSCCMIAASARGEL